MTRDPLPTPPDDLTVYETRFRSNSARQAHMASIIGVVLVFLLVTGEVSTVAWVVWEVMR